MRRPDFFLVGAPKCGTTSMCNYLSEHPEVYVPPGPEPNYFGRDRAAEGAQSEEQYLAQFAAAGEARRAGEKSVWYLYSENAVREILEFSPSARIIIMLRDPVDMVYSLHSQLLFTRDEDIRDFAEALAAEPDRAAGRRIPASARFHQGLLYRQMGKYSGPVARYMEAFGDRVKVILFEDLRADTAAAYRQTCEFLDVAADFQPDFRVYNVQRGVRSPGLADFYDNPPGWLLSLYRKLVPEVVRRRLTPALRNANVSYEPRAPMDPETRKSLIAEFAPDVERLGELLGRDLSGWCR